MSLDYRISQEKAQADVQRNIAVDKVLIALRGYLISAGPYDRIEILTKQNGLGFTIRKVSNQQEEINFERSK